MYKIDDIVITPNEMPAVVTLVLDNGLKYKVAEMPKLSDEDINKVKMGFDECLDSVINEYSIDELRIPNDDEQARLAWLRDDGANFPVVN